MKWPMRILVCLSVVLLVAAGVAYFYDDANVLSDEAPPPFVVGQTDFVLVGIEPGLHELIVPITNPAKVPRHILGVAEG